MKKFLGLLCSLAIFLAFTSSAIAISFNATVTADNHYAIYFGDETSVTYVGRNELGAGGSPGQYNWSLPEMWAFDVDVDDYIYVVGWSDDNVAQGWIGQFISSGYTLLSNTTEWDVLLTGNNLNDGSPAPTADQLESDINGATWGSVNFSLAHGSSPWGYISGISSEADWIWGSRLTPGSGTGEYQIFRTRITIPEPANMFLMGTGLLGLAMIGRRKFFKK
jgi:hypothetical protein